MKNPVINFIVDHNNIISVIALLKIRQKDKFIDNIDKQFSVMFVTGNWLVPTQKKFTGNIRKLIS